MGPPEVFEGLQPLVADLDGDGVPEVVTTVADSSKGARIAVLGADGDRLATGPVYGPGWRHQLAVAGFGPDGGPELAVVRKPHVDRVVEFYRLDGAVAADLDGDGRVELLAPTSDRETLAAVRRTADGAEVAWRHPLDGPVRSNVTGVATSSSVAVGAATADTVSVWQG